MTHPKRNGRSIWLTAVAGTAVLTAVDQFSKYLAIVYLKNSPSVVLLPGVFELSYLENQGAAWGIFYGMRWGFLIVTSIFLAAICYAWKIVPFHAKYKPFRILTCVLAAGAVGNAIDRLFRGFVVDFFYFCLIDFPVFNVADCYVCIALFLILILYRNEDYSWMNKKS